MDLIDTKKQAKQIAYRIESLCDKKGISVRGLLISCGLKGSLVDNLKKGSIPSADKIAIVAEALEVSTDHIMGKEQKNKPTDNKVSELRPELYEALRVLNSLPDDVREQEIARLKILSDAINRSKKD